MPKPGAGERAQRQAVVSLTRRCVMDKARLRIASCARQRPDRWATSDDAIDFFADLRKPVGSLRQSLAAVFSGPEWEFTGLWTATRHQVRGMPRLVKMYRLRTPEERRAAA